MKYPKVLVISHNCFSKSGSNGRTLANFFKGYPKDRIAQFYIYNEMPDSDICDVYYRVTDNEVIKSFFCNDIGKVIKSGTNINNCSFQERKNINKTPLIYLIRELVWSIGRWKNKKLYDWIKMVSPDLILFQAGDAAFLFLFSYKLAKTLKIPLIIYNSESYYFKEKNYLSKSLLSNFSYKILHWYFKKCAKKTILFSKASIYISDGLKHLYDLEFKKESYTIMTSTELTKYNFNSTNKRIKISYLGNLGVGRVDALIELGEILQSISRKYVIEIYGKASQEAMKKFSKCDGTNYHGFVSYEKCIKIMEESIILVHVESFKKFYLEDSKYAFSTKIADSLASGVCFFLYAPKEIDCTKYLENNHVACVATDPNMAFERLKELLENETIRDRYVQNALNIVNKNHSMEKNKTKFINILLGVWERSLDENITN